MRLRDLGEFALIDRLAALAPDRSPRVLVGIGDDAAVLRPSPDPPNGSDLLLTTDAFVEGVHFFPLGSSQASPEDLGYKAIAANVSDIAAMGGTPTAAVVALACHSKTSVEITDGLYRGMAEAAREYGLDLVGGDTVSTDGPMVITVSLLGEVPAGTALLRSGARPGEVIAVTGTLGDARGALELVGRGAWGVGRKTRDEGRGTRDEEEAPGTHTTLLSRLFRPTARLKEGQALRETAVVTAAMDISDGLAGDLRRLAEASAVGVEIFEAQLPLSPELLAVFGLTEARRLALEGGEDFELLFTCPEDRFEGIRDALRDATSTACSAIGRVVEDASALLLRIETGASVPLPEGSWVHFQSRPGQQAV